MNMSWKIHDDRPTAQQVQLWVHLDLYFGIALKKSHLYVSCQVMYVVHMNVPCTGTPVAHV